MRAYVITDRIDKDHEDDTNVIGVTSSRKTAIEGCEEVLGRTGEQGVIKWHSQNKHSGFATLGDHIVTYGMYFVNQIEE